jgi:hypothetical protein
MRCFGGTTGTKTKWPTHGVLPEEAEYVVNHASAPYPEMIGDGTTMKIKQKRWSDLTTAELAAATREFDDPTFDPPALKPSARQAADLRRVQRKAAKDRFRVAIALERDLIEQADQYASSHGITFSQLVADALRRLIEKKSA